MARQHYSDQRNIGLFSLHLGRHYSPRLVIASWTSFAWTNSCLSVIYFNAWYLDDPVKFATCVLLRSINNFHSLFFNRGLYNQLPLFAEVFVWQQFLDSTIINSSSLFLSFGTGKKTHLWDDLVFLMIPSFIVVNKQSVEDAALHC